MPDMTKLAALTALMVTVLLAGLFKLWRVVRKHVNIQVACRAVS